MKTTSSFARFFTKTVLACLLSIYTAQGQTFFIKENFSGASDSTPPSGWQARRISGGTSAGFRFDNKANLQSTYPLQAPFAAFDAPSSIYQGSSQIVALESAELDLTGKDKLLLSFDHQYVEGSEASGKVQVLANNVWSDVEVYTQTTSGTPTVVADVSNLLSGMKNVRVRFLWTGKNTGSWVIDNVKLFAPSPLDAGIVSIDAPVSPFGEGPSPVEVSLFNYGATTLTGSKIRWSVNGTLQTDFIWSGSLEFAKKKSNIRLGTLDMRAGASYLLKVWSEDPNGQLDGNPSNDTTIRTLIPSLCGNYTIGGTNPNFPTISRAAEYLHNAGVGCPVVFKIRDGQYVEQPEFRAIRGTSFVNTVTFESESGDSTKVRIFTNHSISSYPYTMSINGSRHLRFRKLTLAKQGTYWDYNVLDIAGESYDVKIENCFLDAQLSTGIIFKNQTDSVVIQNNYIRGNVGGTNISTQGIYFISAQKTYVRNNRFSGFSNIGIYGNGQNINIESNLFDNIPTGCYLRFTGVVNIQDNIIRNAKSGLVLFDQARYNVQRNHISIKDGVGIECGIGYSSIKNNWIHDKFSNSGGKSIGIKMYTSFETSIYHNTIHIYNGGSASRSLDIAGSRNINIINNILAIKNLGLPISLTNNTSGIKSDYNNLYSPNGIPGDFNGKIFQNLSNWSNINRQDSNSVSVNPFFTNDSILIPNNMQINDKAKYIPEILDDIDRNPRINDYRDIGAKEISKCSNDAGVGFILSPKTPLDAGIQDVTIQLMNHGKDTLRSVRIGWKTSNDTTSYFHWTGTLFPDSTVDVKVGALDIKPSTSYQIKAWTIDPNSITDCNKLNDTCLSNVLFSRLCGTYTIGGTNPDFLTIKEAVEFLNIAGVSCQTTFLIRNGTYNELISIDSIPGASSLNNIIFKSESGDSSLVQISTHFTNNPIPYTIRLNGTKHITLSEISISKNGTNGTYHALEISGNAFNVNIINCRINPLNASGIVVKDKSDSIIIRKNHLTGSGSGNSNTSGDGIFLSVEGMVLIDNNFITSFYSHGVFGGFINNQITRNRIEKVRVGANLSSYQKTIFSNNTIQSTTTGIIINGIGYVITNNKIEFRNNFGLTGNFRNSVVSNNWIGITQNNDQKTTAAFLLTDCENVRLVHNTAHLKVSESNTNVLQIDRGTNITWQNNSFSLKNLGAPISIINTATNLKADRNNYYSPYGVIGSINGKVFNDLNKWKSEALLDSNSLLVNPFFQDESQLIPSHVMLNGSAIPLPDIDRDIDSTLRDKTNPDIGAKEFSLCEVDAGISEIITPTNPLRNDREIIKVRLFNHGTSVLNNVTIGWRLNEQPHSVLNWTGSLASGKYEDIIIDSINFTSGKPNFIKSWTTSPNLITDCKTSNDTSASTPLYTRLCGTYTIGGNAPSFKTIKEAVEVLNLAGVSCAVKFLIRNGTYTEQIVLDSIRGSSPINTVTFESESGDSSKVQIISDHFVSLDPFTFNLNRSKHVRLNKIAIGKQGTYWDFHALEISGDAKDIIISNCLINPRYGTGIIIKDSADQVVIRNSFITGNNSILTYARLDGIRMNSIKTAHIYDNVISGIQSSGIYSTSGRIYARRNKISSSFTGIELYSVDTTLVAENDIRKVKDGIILNNAAKYHIDANSILFSTGTGISLSNTNYARISNNWVSNLEKISTNGISLRNASNALVLFNAINITGTNNNSSGMDIQGGSNNKLFNNIIKNASGGFCMKISNGSTNLLADYNCYYAPLNNIGVLNDKLYNELSQWGAALKGEAGSIFINPFFRNYEDVKPNHILLNDAGVRYDPVTHDIDSSLRNPVSPDIGAKEFVPCDLDAGINEFTSPSLSLSTGKQDIKVVLQNQGLLSLNSVRIHWTLNGAVQPTFEWIGTLTTRKNVEVNIGNFEFQSGPEWIIKAWTSMPNGEGDCNPYNDTTVLKLPGTSDGVPPPPTARDTTICKGSSVILKAKGIGRLGWYTASKGGTWLGGDSVFTTPALQSTTIYYVQDSVMGASLARTAVTVKVFDAPAFNPFPDRIYSKANDLTLAIDSSLRPKTVNWNTGSTSTSQVVKYSGSYNVMVITDAGCRLTDTVFVQFPDTAILKVGLVNGSCAEPVEVPVSVQNFRRISRFMGEMAWDTARLRFDSLRIFQEPGMKPSDFTTTQTTAGRLRFQWATNDTSWKSLPDTTVIFAVRLIPTTSEFSTWPVSLNTDPTLFRFQDDRPVTLKSIAMNGGVAVNTCLMKLEGRVLTPLDEGVVNVQMTLTGPDAKQTLTRQDGTYALSANKGIYTLSPFKNNEREKLNGISTFDIALIQSHLLFRQRLANPYKVIAADANNSGSITTADVLFLRRMLLRIDTSLPGNRTWAFVDADQTFPNPDMPFPFRSTRSFNDLFGKVTHSFRAVKLGDVNYDRNPKLDQTWGRDTLKLIAEIKELPGLRYRILIKSDAIDQLMGFQGTLSWDSAHLSLLTINENPLEIGLGEGSLQQGKLLFSWNDPKAFGMNISKGSLMLDMTFQAKRGNTLPVLSLTDDILAREAFNQSFQKINMQLSMPVSMEGSISDASFHLHPNPAKTYINATWRSAQKETVTLRLLDATGRTVWTRNIEQTPGINKQSIAIPKEISGGMYLLRLETNTSRVSRSLVIER